MVLFQAKALVVLLFWDFPSFGLGFSNALGIAFGYLIEATPLLDFVRTFFPPGGESFFHIIRHTS